MFAKEMVAYELAIVGFVGLIFAVDGVFHDLAQDPFFIACKQGIPIATPNHFDHVPAATPKIALKLLNDFAVAAYGAI